MGVMRGSGSGSGVMGYKALSGTGDAIYGKNESAYGSGVFGHRLVGAGHGFGVLGHAEGVNAKEDASVAAIKTAKDNGYALFVNSKSTDSALRVSAGVNSALAIDSFTDIANASPVSNRFERANGDGGTAAEFVVSGSGQRSQPLAGQLVAVFPPNVSNGAATVSGQSIVIGESVQGSRDVRGGNANVFATKGEESFGYRSQVTGDNTTNYGVYSNATGGKVNWSGYFVGDVLAARVLVPADKKHQDIHGEADYQKSLENVMAGKVYVSDRYITWKETDAQGAVVEKRQKVSSNELNVLAEDVKATNPEAVKESEDGSLSISDREELYQLKAAVIYLTKRLKEKGVDVTPGS